MLGLSLSVILVLNFPLSSFFLCKFSQGKTKVTKRKVAFAIMVRLGLGRSLLAVPYSLKSVPISLDDWGSHMPGVKTLRRNDVVGPPDQPQVFGQSTKKLDERFPGPSVFIGILSEGPPRAYLPRKTRLPPHVANSACSVSTMSVAAGRCPSCPLRADSFDY